MISIGCSVALATVGSLSQISTSEPRTPLTISVAASLQDAIQAVQSLYEEQAPDVVLTFNIGSSGSLQRQIEQGAPVDLFISAAGRQMDALEEKGLILPETRTDLVINKLVLITPIQGPQIESPQDLTQVEIKKIALGEPTSVPAGAYAEQALTALDLFSDLESKFIFGKDVRQVLNYVVTGNVEAGLVYQTDALLSNAVEVAYTFPPEAHDPIVYPMAVLKDSPYPEAAEAFATFLMTDDAQEVLTELGFSQSEG